MRTEFKDINGETIKEGDIVIWIRPTPNRFGYRCRAYHVVKPERLKSWALVGRCKRNRWETPLPVPSEGNMLTIVGNVATGTDKAKSAAIHAIKCARSKAIGIDPDSHSY